MSLDEIILKEVLEPLATALLKFNRAYDMLAPEFVAAEIQEWVDSDPRLDKDQKETMIELSKRIIQAYEFYRHLVTGLPADNG